MCLQCHSVAHLFQQQLITRQQLVRNRHSLDVIYFYFAKAFDSVSHPKLVHKLQAYGLSGCILNILTDFISARTQRVVLPENRIRTMTFRFGFCLVIYGYLGFVRVLAHVFSFRFGFCSVIYGYLGFGSGSCTCLISGSGSVRLFTGT